MKVIYHANCTDGFCSAYLFWKVYPEAEFIPMSYGTPLDLSIFEPDDRVVIVDFSFKQPILLDLAESVKNVIVLDHHKTAQQDLDHDHWPNNVYVNFDMNRSGAMMAHDFLFPGREPSDLVKYVQDRDLWKFDLPNSREVSAYIQALDFDFKVYEQLEREHIGRHIIMGSAILLKINQQVKQAVRHAAWYILGEHKIKATNSTVNFSEVAGELAKGEPFGVAWFYRSDGKYQYSLRSDENGLDVSEIARSYGGGGHVRASGFESDSLVLIPCE